MNADFINLCLFYYTSCSPTDLFSPIVVSYVKSGDTPEPQPTEMFSVTLSLQDDFDVTSDIDPEEDHEYPVPKGRSFVFTLKSSTPPSSTSMIIPSAIKDGDDPTLLDGTLQSDGSTLFVVENVTEPVTVIAEGKSMPYVYTTQGTFTKSKGTKIFSDPNNINHSVDIKNSTYDSTKTYAFESFIVDNVKTITGNLSIQISGSKLKVQNDAISPSVLFDTIMYGICSRTENVSTVIVYDSCGKSFWAFVYTENDTIYYCVLDGNEHPSWFTNLEANGYYLEKPLFPEVAIRNSFNTGLYALNQLEVDDSITEQDSSYRKFVRLNNNDIIEGLYYSSVDSPSGSKDTIAVYDTDKMYAVVSYLFKSGGGNNDPVTDPTYLEFIKDDNGYIGIKNVSNTDDLFFYKARAGVVSFPSGVNKSDTSIVKVYRISDGLGFNAVKYKSFYLVLDENKKILDWTDDLESIGFSTNRNKPEVNLSGYLGTDNIVYASQSRIILYSLQSEESTILYYNNGHNYACRYYDSSKYYVVTKWYPKNDGKEGEFDTLEIVSKSSDIGVKNKSSKDITVFSARVAVCGKELTEVVKLKPINGTEATCYAFKFDDNGTIYYYVLDENHNDWYEDISSIGYSEL